MLHSSAPPVSLLGWLWISPIKWNGSECKNHSVTELHLLSIPLYQTDPSVCFTWCSPPPSWLVTSNDLLPRRDRDAQLQICLLPPFVLMPWHCLKCKSRYYDAYPSCLRRLHGLLASHPSGCKMLKGAKDKPEGTTPPALVSPTRWLEGSRRSSAIVWNASRGYDIHRWVCIHGWGFGLDHALIALSLPSWVTFLVPLGWQWLPANVQKT